MKKSIPFMFYLFYFSAVAFSMPFIILYYQESGFNPVQIGLLMGISPLVSMLGAPLWTGLADAKGHHKLIMSLSILGAVAIALVFPFFKSFPPVVLLIFLLTLFGSPIIAFADSATLAMLGDKKDRYGRVRLGGTIGWGIFASLAGLVIQSYGLRWVFWGYASIMLLVLIVSQRFSFGSRAGNISFGAEFRKMLANRRWILFLSLAIVGGMALATINNLLSAYLEELGFSRSTIGLALTLATVGELPVLFYSHHLLKRFGAFGLLMLGMTITGARMLLYAWVDFPAGILICQLLNGMTFPVVWVASVSYANENAPEGMKATAQGFLGAMMFGVGAAAGGLVGGTLLESLGGRWMYLLLGLFVLASVSVVTLLERAELARKTRGLA